MNKINCPRCGFANEADLNFCLNCGAALRAQPQPNFAPPQTASSAAANVAANNLAPLPQTKKSGGKMLLFGGLGCAAVLFAGFAGLAALLMNIGANSQNQNSRNAAIVNTNRAAANRRQSTAANANSTDDDDENTLSGVANTNDNSASSSSSGGSGGGGDSETLTEAQTEKILAPELGGFKRRGDIEFDAPVEMDGAQTAAKADYAFNNKTLEVSVVEFADTAAAKNGYTDFLANSRANAKIIKREKTATKNNDKGEYVVYTFKENGKTQYESLFYSGKFAFHFVAPDQLTLTLFLVAFAANAQAVS